METLARRFPQLDALSRTFLARFFESEITTGFDDLKGAFFWLLAALAVPGMVLPWLRAFGWELIVLLHGVEAVREVSRSDKIFYLGYTMTASGFLTAIAWSSLLPDRRDALILGTLPVKPRIVVFARLVSLLVYMLTVAVFMHTVGAVLFGSLLSIDRPFAFLARGVVAHFVAALAAGMTVCLAVTAAQGLALSITGPRLFARISTALQVAVVGSVALCLAYLPAMTSGIVPTLRGSGPGVAQWILLTPPAWFLGLYEWILGTDDPLLHHLARLAGLALLVSAAVTAATLPLSYRRLMVSVTETGGGSHGAWMGRVRRTLVAAAGRHAAARGAADFFTASLARVERHRFVVAISIGLALAWGLPGWMTIDGSALPSAGVLALPVSAMMFLLVGLRIAASLPGDERAGWLFEVLDTPRRQARQAVERTILLLGILPPLVLSAPVYASLWGGRVAITHGIVMLGLGVLITEMLLWRSDGMPCGQRWSPGRLDLGRRWPVYAAVFLLITVVIPRIERALLFKHPAAMATFVVLLLLVAAGVRHAAARRVIVDDDDADPVAGLLRLQ